MIIDLANVGTTVRKIEVAFDPADIDLDGENLKLIGKLTLDAELVRSRSGVELNGQIQAALLIDCTRCLAARERQFDFEFRAVFVEADQISEAAEVEVADDALDESVSENGKIELAEVVREQLLLAVPQQNFCREDCRGLCLKCGENLNLIDCKCAGDEVDPRWAALKDFK